MLQFELWNITIHTPDMILGTDLFGLTLNCIGMVTTWNLSLFAMILISSNSTPAATLPPLQIVFGTAQNTPALTVVPSSMSWHMSVNPSFGSWKPKSGFQTLAGDIQVRALPVALGQ